MGRKLAEATKACRMRRTRGETTRALCVLVLRRCAPVAAGLLPGALCGTDSLGAVLGSLWVSLLVSLKGAVGAAFAGAAGV